MNRAYLPILSLLCLSSCAAMLPEILKTAEDVIDDDAVRIIVSKEAFQRNTNLKATVELDNGQIQQK